MRSVAIGAVIAFLVIVVAIVAYRLWMDEAEVAQAEPPPDYSHVLRVQISVEFDGERVDFDDLVFCGVREKGTLTTRPVTQVLPSRWTITRVLSDGGMLGFRVAWPLCSLVQHRWRPGITEDREYKAPENYLPPFHWFDSADPATKTTGEAYISEAYLNAPYARLRILTPFRFSVPVHPPTRELLAEAFAQEDAEEERGFAKPLRMDTNIFAVSREEWSNVEFLEERRQRIGVLVGIQRPDWNRFVGFLNGIPPSRGLVLLHQRDEEHAWLFSPLLGRVDELTQASG